MVKKIEIGLFFLLILFNFSSNGYAQCSAKFTAVRKTCQGKNIQFTANSTGTNYRYFWNFGDLFAPGNTNFDTIYNPQHNYSKAGTYKITLFIQNTSTSCRDTVTDSLMVFSKPLASFTYTNICENILAQYFNTSKIDTKDSLTSIKWNLDSNITSTLANPTHSHAKSGTYNVRLIIATAANCHDTISKNLTIYEKPSAQISATSVCLNNSITFEAKSLNSATSYTYFFGDSSTFTSRVLSHTYSKKAGIMKPQLLVTFPDATCTVNLDSIRVHALPSAEFAVNQTPQCFNTNEVCVKLTKPSKNMKTRTVVFDDGYSDNSTPLSDSLICHSYVDANGGVYSLTMEVTDSNGCISKVTKDSIVKIHPEVKAAVEITGSSSCFNTPIKVVNKSNLDSNETKSFTFLWGDSNSETQYFSSKNHTYTNEDSITISLFITDYNNCSDSLITKTNILNTTFKVDAKISKINGLCHNKNKIHFQQSTIANANIYWDFGQTFNTFADSFSYGFVGTYYPKVTISKNNCDSTIYLDSIIITGPVANFYADNDLQCYLKDTVIFHNISTAYKNKHLSVFWDAYESNCPTCTTNRVKNLNPTTNCRYSTDSLVFKHFYSVADCYKPMLIVKDSLLGCSDTAYTKLNLSPPSAQGKFKPLSKLICPGPNTGYQYKTINIDLNLDTNNCYDRGWHVMWDSLAARRTSNFDSNWIFSYGWNYPLNEQVGDSNGYITVGLYIAHGYDSTGKACADTAWFHNALRVVKVNPTFYSNYNDSQHFCRNQSIEFWLQDTLQTSGVRYYWVFGDGTVIDTLKPSKQTHKYRKSGTYTVTLYTSHPDGCTQDYSMQLNIGTEPSFAISNSQFCLGTDSFQLTENTKYYDTATSPIGLFSDSIRRKQNKEYTLFNLDDNLGYREIDLTKYHQVNKVGFYNISMIAVDSTGCHDTLLNHVQLKVTNAFAGFKFPYDTLICSQLVSLNSTADTKDSNNTNTLLDDSIVSYEYDFGSNSSKSVFKNPARIFKVGKHEIKQTVSNAYGCIDSIKKTLVVVGPLPHYTIVSDSMGCSPHRVTFKNNSAFANEYVWKFNDINNNSLTTKSDSQVFLNYQHYGLFYPSLVAKGTYTINGVTNNCEAQFPDTTALNKNTITVYEKPKAEYVYSTDCETLSTLFINTSILNTGSLTFSWDFGDGGTSTDEDPIHYFSDTGVYRVKMTVYSPNGCMDTFVEWIKISTPPNVNFTYRNTCFGESTIFINSSYSYNDYLTIVQWGLGDGSWNAGDSIAHKYDSIGNYLITLFVMNSAGCMKTLDRTIKINPKPVPHFTFDTVCFNQPTKLKNTSTSNVSFTNANWKYTNLPSKGTWNDTVVFKNPNLNAVKLIVQNANGCIDSISQNVKVNSNPNAKYSILDSDHCFNSNFLTLQAKSTIDSGTLTHFWNTTGSTNVQTDSVKFQFLDTGIFKIKLKAVSNNACVDSSYLLFRVFPSLNPLISSANNTQCFKNNAFRFNDSTSTTLKYQRKWNANYSTFDTTKKPQYSFKDTGKFTVKLITTTANGCIDSSQISVNVISMPQSNFEINDSQQCFKNHNFICLNNSKSYAGNLTAQWTISDNNSYTSKDIQHKFLASGNYKISLISTSSFGCKDTFTSNVMVDYMPKAAFKINDSIQCLIQNSFDFTNLSTLALGTQNFQWNFGDSTSSQNNQPNKSYSAYGNYNVRLVSISNNGCRDTFNSKLFVAPMPKAMIKLNDSSFCYKNQDFEFTDVSTIPSGRFKNKYWRYNSTTSADSIIQPKFPKDSSYKLTLTAVSNFDCIDSTIQKITVYPNPKVGFTINDSIQCFRANRFELSNTSTIASGNIDSFQWNLNEDILSYTKNLVFNADSVGQFNINLIAKSNFNCIDSLIYPITVYPMPIANMRTIDSQICFKSNKITLEQSAKIAYGKLKYLWFTDKLIDTVSGNASTFSFDSIGIKNITLITTSDQDCADTMVKTITIQPMPNIKYHVNQFNQCINNQNFQFTDSSNIVTGALNRYWVFQDSISSLKRVNRTFDKTGEFPIRLIQVSDFNCADTVDFKIRVISKPDANFNLVDTLQCLYQNSFSPFNLSTTDSGILRYTWIWGDQQSDTVENPQHQYTNTGRYTILLIASNYMNCLDSQSLTIHVAPMPMPKIWVNDSTQCKNSQEFNFKSYSSIQYGSLTHHWNHGNGNHSLLDSFTDFYTSDSNYTVKLIEISDLGCMDSLTQTIHVLTIPNASFAINDSIQCLKYNDFAFVNQSTIKGGSLNYNWYFGDANFDVSQDPSHNYLNSGKFAVTLISTSNLNCSDTFGGWVTVKDHPVSDFTVDVPNQCFRNHSFSLGNTSTIISDTIIASIWLNQTDSVFSTNPNPPVLMFATHGIHTVKLISTSNFGCIDTLSKKLVLNPTPQAQSEVNRPNQCINEQHFVIKSVSNISNGKISKTTWNYADNPNTLSGDSILIKNFNTIGTKSILLTVSSDSNCLDSLRFEVVVLDKPTANFTVNDSAQCLNQNNYIFQSTNQNSAQISNSWWQINKNTYFNQLQLPFKFTDTGLIPIYFSISNLDNCKDTQTKYVYIKPMPNPTFDLLKEYYCQSNIPQLLNPVVSSGYFQGKNIFNNTYIPMNLWEDTITYYAILNGCIDSSTQATKVYPPPSIELGNDTILCQYETLTLTLNSWKSKYLWENGSIDDVRKIKDKGKYFVTATNVCGTSYDELYVDYKNFNCHVFIPNAFSPNNQEPNNYYKPILYNVEKCEYLIFNRWGEKIFVGNMLDDGWDGTVNGVWAPEGNYIIQVTYQYSLDSRKIKKTESQTFLLIR